MKQITGAELFVKALKEEAVDTLFAYPGGQAIDLFHALYGEREIDVILPRHEQGLIHGADGYARSTGKVGVCLVTSGPGLRIWLQALPPRIMTAYRWCALRGRCRHT